MEQFLDMNFRNLFEQYNNLVEALYRSYDRLQNIIDMVFPACVLRTIDCKYGNHIHIMTEDFYDIHYNKIIDEYQLHNTINQQLKVIEQIHEVFYNYSIIKYSEFILQLKDYKKIIHIDVHEKPIIYINTNNGKYRIQISNKMYKEFRQQHFSKNK